MKITRKHIAIVVFATVLVGGGVYAVSAQNHVEPVKKHVESTKVNDSAPKTDVETAETAPEGAQAVENEKTYVTPSETPNQPPQPAPKQESAHIPFTNEPVVAGEPETYVGTVGQCPFYEIVNEKGCTPPPDIECNADWSVCTRKEN